MSWKFQQIMVTFILSITRLQCRDQAIEWSIAWLALIYLIITLLENDFISLRMWISNDCDPSLMVASPLSLYGSLSLWGTLILFLALSAVLSLRVVHSNALDPSIVSSPCYCRFCSVPFVMLRGQSFSWGESSASIASIGGAARIAMIRASHP